MANHERIQDLNETPGQRLVRMKAEALGISIEEVPAFTAYSQARLKEINVKLREKLRQHSTLRRMGFPEHIVRSVI